MATNTVTNWFGDIVSHPQVVVEANSVDDIVRILKDPATIHRRCARSDPITRPRPAESPTAEP